MRELNKEFMRALGHFSHPPIDAGATTVHAYTTTDKDGWKTPWTAEQVCSIAYELLAGEELYRLKFIALAEGMKKSGGALLYSYIMHNEDIDKAIKDAKA